MEYSKIKLCGKKEEYCLVSNEHFDTLNKFKWRRIGRYIHSKIDKKLTNIHRYIFQVMLKENITEKLIDHINRNPLDNRIENLRIVTCSDNNKNRSCKTENSTSQYNGVSSSRDKWKVVAKVPNKISAYYSNEIHAAHQYNLWIDEYKLEYNPRNNIEIPTDFIQYKKREKSLPENIRFREDRNKFYVTIGYDYKLYRVGTYEKLEDAIKAKEEKMVEIRELEFKKSQLKPEIKRNKNGDCIIEHFNRKKEKISETIVDEDMYYDLIKYKWSVCHKYAQTKMGEKCVRMSRYIMNCYDNRYYIDHIDHNPYNNRRNNLKIVTPTQNNLNKSSQKNSSSKYTGVSWDKKGKKWLATIGINGVLKNIGHYTHEIDAYNARKAEFDKYMEATKIDI